MTSTVSLAQDLVGLCVDSPLLGAGLSALIPEKLQFVADESAEKAAALSVSRPAAKVYVPTTRRPNG